MIEIDEVLVAISASGFRRRCQLLEDLTLDLFFLGRRLDHHVAIGEQRVIEAHLDAAERGILFFFADLAARDLTRQVAVDGFAAALQRLLVDVGHDHIDAGERADMGDAAAHLPGADDADAAQPVERQAGAALTGGARARRRAPGRILNKSPTRP